MPEKGVIPMRSTGLLVWFGALAAMTSACASDRPAYYLDPETDQPRVESTVVRDPVLETPSDPIWRNTWVPIVNPERDTNPSTRLIDTLLTARPGMVIADVGAGGGYFSFRYAEAVGPTGFVHAIDIDGRMTRKIAFEMWSRGVTNMRAVQVPEGQLGLAPSSTDFVMFIDTGAFATCRRENAVRYLEQAADALRSGGRMLVFNNRTRPEGDGDCPFLTPSEIVRLAAPRFSHVQVDTVSKGDWHADAVLLAVNRAE